MIGDSELIITNEGCIYHLDLHPDELAETVITVGDPGRVEQISTFFDTIEHRKAHREFITHTGYIGKKRISVLSSGIGPDNIDIVLNELDALVNIDFQTRRVKEKLTSLNILRFGTSGSLQADIPVDSLVASSFGIGLDNLMYFYQLDYNAEEEYLIQQFRNHTHLLDGPIVPYIAEGSIKLRNFFTDGFFSGITVTCPGFYAPQGRQLRLATAYPQLINSLASFRSGSHQITNFEMETSAIYGLGKLFGHHCLSINTIIANRQTQTFSRDPTKSVKKMIETSLEIIERI